LRPWLRTHRREGSCMSATVKPPEKIVYRLRLQTTNDEGHVRRLRMALKLLLRRFGFRALAVEEEQAP